MGQSERQTILEVKNLNIGFPTAQVVKNVSFQLEQGEVLGIIGETGSGKTISVLSLLGLLPENATIETESLVAFNSEAIGDLLPRKIAVVFQNAGMSLNPIKKCGWQVARIIRKHQNKSRVAAHEEVIRLFEQVEITDPDRIFDSYPHEISGGELQRVMIAMGLSCSPELLILDEPMASLDKIVQKTIIDLLKRLIHRQTLTLVIISHDLEMIADISDRIIHLHRGEKIADQITEDFFLAPQNGTSRALIEQLKDFRNQEYKSHAESTQLMVLDKCSKVFEGGKVAFENIDLEINRREVIGLIGESGSGKSTLGKCIAGILQYSSGIIEKKVKNLKSAYLFQDAYNAMDPDLTVSEIIEEVLRLQPKPAKVEDLLQSVKLELTIAKRKIHELSGGQRQRVNLARGLAMKSDLLICDEITSGLDVNVQVEIIDLLTRLNREMTIIFISHDISLVKFFCNRVIIMKNGSIVDHGTSKYIFSESSHEYTLQLINSMPEVKYFLNI